MQLGAVFASRRQPLADQLADVVGAVRHQPRRRRRRRRLQQQRLQVRELFVCLFVCVQMLMSEEDKQCQADAELSKSVNLDVAEVVGIELLHDLRCTRRRAPGSWTAC